jgi:hypothetical protein
MCLECSEELSWEDLQAFRLMRQAKESSVAKVLHASLMVPAASEEAAAALDAVLAMDSDEKRLAKDAGMLRPFLALVAMGFEERVKVGDLLEVAVLVHSFRQAMSHGDGAEPYRKDIWNLSFDPSLCAHQEAWMLIASSGAGIQARSNEFYQFRGWNATWDATLLGVCKTVFGVTRKVKLNHADSLRRCMNPVDPRCKQLESELLDNMTRKETWLHRAASAVLPGTGQSTEAEPTSAPAQPGNVEQPPSGPFVDVSAAVDVDRDRAGGIHEQKTQSAVFADGSAVHGEANQVLDLVQLTSTQILGECVQIPITIAAANLASAAVEHGTAAAVDAGAAAAAAAGSSALLAGTVVLGVISTLMLLWDLLDLAFGPSFGRLLPAAYAICTNLQSLELLGPLERFDIAVVCTVEAPEAPLIEEAEPDTTAK